MKTNGSEDGYIHCKSGQVEAIAAAATIAGEMAKLHNKYKYRLVMIPLQGTKLTRKEEETPVDNKLSQTIAIVS